eukprot:3062874-Rhodomonas_salina.1
MRARARGASHLPSRAKPGSRARGAASSLTALPPLPPLPPTTVGSCTPTGIPRATRSEQAARKLFFFFFSAWSQKRGFGDGG